MRIFSFSKLRTSTKFSLAFMLLITITLLGSAYLIYHSIDDEMHILQAKRLKHIAATTSLFIRPEVHSSIISNFSKNGNVINSSPLYKKTQYFLNQIKEKNNLKRDIYTFFYPQTQRENIIILVSSSGLLQSDNLGEINKLAKIIYHSGEATFSNHNSLNDSLLISGAAPIKNLEGKVIGGVFVDYNIKSKLLVIQKRAFNSALIPILVSLLGAFLLTLLMGYIISAPIVKLAKLSKKVAKGEFIIKDTRKIYHNEIGLLYNNFHKMVINLKRKDEQIQNYTHSLEEIIHERTKELKQSNHKLKNKLIELNKYQRQLVDKERLASLGSIVAGVGHEINNPLMILIGHNELAYNKLLTDSSLTPTYIKELLDIQNIAITRISLIVNNLKQYSRKESDSNNKNIMSLNKVLKNNFELIHKIYQNEGIHIYCELEESNLRVQGCVSKFQQVIMNILTNAKHATQDNRKSKREILITTQSNDHEVELRISDNGKGISEEIQERIFEPFFTTKNVGQGTGLGLGICKTLIQSMSGSIEVASQLEKGTTFKITLPLNKDNTQTVNGESSISQIKRNLISSTALVLDDDDNVRDVIVMVLEESGFIVKSFSDPHKALAVLKNEKFDFIFTDYLMPKMNGFQFARFIRENLNIEDYIILVSGDIDINDSQYAQGSSCPFNAKLSKPFSFKDLEDVIYKIKNKNVA